MPNTNKTRVINAFEVYFRRDGVKKAVLKNSLTEVQNFKRTLRFNKRKFLGYRPVKLAELMG